jgi:cytochrome P450
MLSLSTATISLTTAFSYLFPTAIITIIGIVSWRYWAKRKLYQSLKALPSPLGHWLLGNIPQVLAAVKKKQFFQLLFDWSQQYGSIYVYWVGVPVVVLSKPSVIESTVINGMRDGSLIRSQTATRAWNDISGAILLGQSGAEWQWRRKAWNPEFSPVGISAYIGVVEQACSQITDKITADVSSDAIPVDRLFVELTMRVIASLLLAFL